MGEGKGEGEQVDAGTVVHSRISGVHSFTTVRPSRLFILYGRGISGQRQAYLMDRLVKNSQVDGQVCSLTITGRRLPTQTIRPMRGTSI